MAGGIRRLYRGETRIPFIKYRKRWYLASGVLILICVLSFIFRGFNYSIDFAGGTQYTIQIKGTSITTSQVSDAFSKEKTTIEGEPQVVGSGSTKQIEVQTKTVSPAVSQNVAQA